MLGPIPVIAAALTMAVAGSIGSMGHGAIQERSIGGHGHNSSPHNLAPGLYEVPCHPKTAAWRCFISVPIEVNPFASTTRLAGQ